MKVGTGETRTEGLVCISQILWFPNVVNAELRSSTFQGAFVIETRIVPMMRVQVGWCVTLQPLEEIIKWAET